MARTIHNFTRKATLDRERVRKYRKLIKLRKNYQSMVRAEIERRENVDNHDDEASEPESNSDNTYTFNDQMLDFKEKIMCWSVKHCITRRALNDLLSILIVSGFSFLPKDSRTLMKTPVTVDIRELSKGKLWYHGINKYLQPIFQNISYSGLTIHLDFNFDGVELFNSSKKCFCPMIVSIREFPKIEPFVAGIWCGESKPPCSEYLEPFIAEMKDLISNGLNINQHHIIVKFGLCICDTPARVMIKDTVSFNHKNGCQKCEVTGEFNAIYRHMSFPNIDVPRRTDESFRLKRQQSHHKHASPLEELNIDMMKTFPICDPLHLLHQGVTKKLLQRWIGQVKGYDRKWKNVTIESVSRYLVETNKRMPSDVHRSVRGLNELSNWKGVEYRTFLMYIGMTALRDVLREDEYDHFLLLCCACTIVSCKVYKDYIPIATNMFKAYVQGYIRIYGSHSISSNIHNLVHITEDLIENNIDSINEISTYKYENCLRLLGMKLQSCNRPLEQISRRLIEIFHLNTNLLGNRDLDQRIEPDREFLPHVDYELLSSKNCYSKITIKPNVILTSKKVGDQWFLTRSGDIVKMEHAIKVGDSFKICGFSLIDKGPFFVKPLNSAKLSIFMSDGKCNTELCMHETNSIVAKMMSLEIERNFVYIPIQHTLEILK